MVIWTFFVALVSAARVNLAWDRDASLNISTGGHRIYFGEDDSFPFNGNYSAVGGSVSPIAVSLAAQKNPSAPEFTIEGLPSCKLIRIGITAATLKDGAWQKLTADVPFPCLTLAGCDESTSSNLVNGTFSSAYDFALARAASPTGIVVKASWSEPLFGGTGAPFWRLHYAFKDVPAMSSYAAFDGTGAAEGASPVTFAAPARNGDKLQTTLTFASGTTGKVCAYLVSTCAATRAKADTVFSDPEGKSRTATCIDLVTGVVEGATTTADTSATGTTAGVAASVSSASSIGYQILAIVGVIAMHL
jgi:hypothetical protein